MNPRNVPKLLSIGCAAILTVGMLLLILAPAAIDALVSGSWSNALGALAIPLLFVGFFIYTVVRRGGEMRKLVEDGIAVQGRVVRKQAFLIGTNRYSLTYEYRDSSGKSYRRTSFVTRELWSSIEPGAPIGVIYLPQQSQVSALQELVEKASRAGRGKTL